MNQVKTILLLGGLGALLVVGGGALGGKQGATIALVFALVMNVGAYWFSDKMVLAMYKAQQVDESSAPEYYGVVKELAGRAGLPMPKVYIIPSEQPNAFATGRDPQHAAVAATEGILRILNRDELEGVMAHELSHVRHRDILVSTIAATIAGAISYLAQMAQFTMLFGGMGGRDDEEGQGNSLGMVGLIASMILLPMAAMLIQMAISRSREYMADEGGAQISGHPLALASALSKLERGAEVIPMAANPATAHMFIVNPLTGAGFTRLFSTHPATEERIARLQAMASDGSGSLRA